MKIGHQKETQIEMKNKKYSSFWLVFIKIKGKDGFHFNDLIETENKTELYQGAWANIIIKAKDIKEALEIVPLGLDELNFEVLYIDKIENIGSLLEYNELTNDVKEEVKWLQKSEYIFKISNKIFPYK